MQQEVNMKSQNTHTDVVINIANFPFVSLKESEVDNVWYNEYSDNLFSLTPLGFKLIKGSKKIMEKKLNEA